MTRPLNLFIIAGELSADRLGADLMQGLQTKSPGVHFKGVGGPQMQSSGLQSLFDMSDLSVMGLVEILPRIPKLLRRVKETARAAIAAKPDAIITIDSPDFCFRVVSKIKEVSPDIPVIHYVAPSVWAWRPERAEKMARYVDHVLALLPFEPPYMTDAGMSCDFVGHPAAFQKSMPAKDVKTFRSNLPDGFRDSELITLLPGSRRGEISRMAPIFGAVLEQVWAHNADVKVLLPIANGVDDLVRKKFTQFEQKIHYLSSTNRNVEEVDRNKRLAYASSKVALATSGTVALELASEACPMVVAYKANWATTRMVKKLAQIDTANLVNIVTETRDVPEFLFDQCTPENISKSVLELLNNPVARERQVELAKKTMTLLGKGDPKMNDAAVASVLSFLAA